MGLTDLGYKLKIKLLSESKSQTQLAKELGISVQLLSNCLYGESNLKLEEALKHYIKTGEISYVKDNN